MQVFELVSIIAAQEHAAPQSWWHILELQLTFFLGLVLIAVSIPWILMTKKESTSAVAWCLLVFFVPILGTLVFLIFGYQHVHLPLKRKRRHKKQFRMAHGAPGALSSGAVADASPWDELSRLAERFGAYPKTQGNHVKLYHEGPHAYADILEAVAAARHHVHLEYFIVQPDDSGSRLLSLLTEKARQGVEVRLLYDAMGSRRLHRYHLRELREAGGKCSVFLPLNLLRRRIQVNMRDHRKILVVDGKVAFTGGLNIGDEYLGKNARYGYWRDTHVQVRGPAVGALQGAFIENWDFAADENLAAPHYFEAPADPGTHSVQVIASGPDQELNSIREIYFAAILRAQRRLWIATPYFVPDAGLLDALCLVGYRGVDVRLIGQHHPDKWIPYFAGRYYWADVLGAGIKVYQYTRGMIHSKVVLVDGEWASVGTANMDNRSLHLNFEINCLIDSKDMIAELEQAYLRDLGDSIRLERRIFMARPLPARVVENACRLLSPIL